VLAIPICLASVSCLLAPIISIAFCGSFSRFRLSQSWEWLVVLIPTVLFGVPLVASSMLFLSVWPFYRPALHAWLLQLWLAMTVLYFVAGWIILLANYYRAESLQERRRIGALCTVSVLLGLIILHNFFVRNWTGWFGSAPPALFSPMTFVVEAVLFLSAALTLTYCVLSQCVRNQQAQGTAIKPTK
jgi:hypothetical protein